MTCDGPLLCEICNECGCKNDICDCCAVRWRNTVKEAAAKLTNKSTQETSK